MTSSTSTTGKILIPITEYPGYFVCDDGWIYSSWVRGNNKIKHGPLQRLKPGTHTNHYYYFVNLKNTKGGYTSKNIHVLICKAFHGERPSDKHQASHLDGDHINNKPSNLKWETCKENINRKKDHGTDDIGYKNSRASLTEKQLKKIRSLLNKGKLLQSEIAEKFKVKRMTITRIKNNTRYKNQGHE